MARRRQVKLGLRSVQRKHGAIMPLRGWNGSGTQNSNSGLPATALLETTSTAMYGPLSAER
jgi:hypothetical protein